MRFESVHPTDVSDDQAELIFLALATKWADIDKDELAQAFARASVYFGRLPRAFGLRLSETTMGTKFGVLVGALDAEGFRSHVTDRQQTSLTVVAACDPASLARLWDDPRAQYRRDQDLDVRAAELDYEGRWGESHRKTLGRVSTGSGS